MESSTSFCSKCCQMRVVEDFLKNKKGNLNKTCIRHTKKRKMPSLDQWDEFIEDIRTWSHPTQTRTLDINYTFDLDRLPVAFGSQLELTEDGTQNRAHLNRAVNQLVKFIWQSSGFRFRRAGTSSNLYLSYYYRCCQDISLNKDSSSNKVRNRTQMTRFDCNSKLTIKPSLVDRNLSIKLYHKYHTPYQDIRLKLDVLSFVDSHVCSQTPSDIHHNLQNSDSDSCEDSEGKSEELVEALEDKAPKTYDYPEFQSMMRRAMEICDEQEARGNKKFVEKFIESNASNKTLVEEIQHHNSRGSMPLTLNHRKHPATMYYK